MVLKWQVRLPELAGERLRSAYVYLPESYGWDECRRYPVLYMFDGHNVFFDQDATYGKSWGMKEYLDRTQTQLGRQWSAATARTTDGFRSIRLMILQIPSLDGLEGWEEKRWSG